MAITSLLEETNDPIGDPPAQVAPTQALVGDEEMAKQIRDFDWSATPIGPIESWSPALRMMVRFMLANRFPLLLWWGPTFCSIYNDPYRPVLGAKHPWALGRPVSECWSEIWHVLQPLIETPFNGGPATWMEDIELELNRHGFAEETHFTVAYSPVPDESVPNGIGGVLATVHEITEKVVGERRVAVLRDLGARSTDGKTAEEACTIAAQALEQHLKDIPFALFYLIDPDRQRATLVAASGFLASDVEPLADILLDDATSPWPLRDVLQREELQLVDNLDTRFARVPAGSWSEPPRTAAIFPIKSNVSHQLAGFVVAGISVRLRFDEQYRSFFDLVATQVATAIANARAYEEERRRAEALAEIDRAKTAFFSNVSHEFRTPLTLMLGPIEDLLATELAPANRNLVELAHRNSLRLLKLVNALLDFSRIEAGRIQASYEPTDLAAYTVDLASTFRSAIEKAGLKFTVDCVASSQPAYIDRDMWEKIVLNLLSNAFKFTFTGEIAVTLGEDEGSFELSVQDTGEGIAEAEQPRLFERFHRIRGMRSRTHEGTGIGLALVRELVRLHGGDIDVSSEEGRGSRFAVRIPKGSAHLPVERVGVSGASSPRTALSDAFVKEALRWIPEETTFRDNDDRPDAEFDRLIDDEGATPPSQLGDVMRATVLVVDDNADMREYVRRLLASDYEVEVAGDGVAALEQIRLHTPDLVLTDIMMPRLDGVGLLARLRADTRTRTLPVIVLSARAGEESRVDGLAAGADDYLVKPFSAHELQARVRSQLQMARIRRDTEERLRASEARLSAEADALTRLNELSSQLWRRRNLDEGLDEMLAATIELLGADKGNVQLLDGDRQILKIVAQRGFDQEFLDFFREVSTEDDSACGRALRSGSRMVIDDIEADEPYAPLRPIARAAGYRAVQSTPLIARDGRPLGMLSTHFRDVHRPNEQDLRRLDLYIRQAVDFIERCSTDQALSNQSAQLKTLIDQAPLGVYLVDADFRIREVNPIALPVFGDISGGVIGRDLGEVIHILWEKRYADEVVSLFRRTLETGEPYITSERAEFRIDRGVTEYYEWRIDRIPLPEGRYGVVCYFRDISAQVLARKAVEQSREMLKDADRRKDEFLATLSHELRNPLAPIRQAANLLKTPGTNERQAEWARDVIDRQVRAMGWLLDDLLDVARISRGKIELRREIVDLVAVVESAVETARPLIEAKRHVLTIHLPPSPVRFAADPLRLAQVIANLLTNAAKYTDPKGQIRLQAQCESNEVVIRVGDNGIGISTDMLPTVFEMFSQAAPALDRTEGGLGIGLTLVRGFVELHGGRVIAHSDGLGKGSEFIIYLPLDRAVDATVNALPPVAHAPADSTLKVLIADDNRDSAETLAALLQIAGHDVRTGFNGTEALEIAQTFLPDVALLDIGMPKLNGYEAAEYLRNQHWGKYMTLIAVTGWGQEGDVRRAHAAGFDHHLRKPIDMAILGQLLARKTRREPI